jgi:prephenate dehydrogenase
VRLAVVGVGLIGGSIGLAAAERLPEAEVVGHDADPEALRAAKERGAIHCAAATLAEAVEGAELCFLCAPVGALPALIEGALGLAGRGCAVTDVGSTKRGAREAGRDPRFVGGHPIAGAESAGIEHARSDLFAGAAWYLTPGPATSGVLYERLHRVIVALGARPVAIDPDDHDHLLATVSHLPHVLANVLVAQAAHASRAGEALPRVGPSFRDATRVAGASSAIWTDIYVANAAAIAAQVDATVERLRAAADLLRAGDAAAIAAWNDGAADDRRRLLEAEWAGGAVHELRVSVPNRPGTVARVAMALGRAGVNIVDMALAPAPDMRTGAITLWIGGDEAAARARDLIEELGFPVGPGAS